MRSKISVSTIETLFSDGNLETRQPTIEDFWHDFPEGCRDCFGSCPARLVHPVAAGRDRSEFGDCGTVDQQNWKVMQ